MRLCYFLPVAVLATYCSPAFQVSPAESAAISKALTLAIDLERAGKIPEAEQTVLKVIRRLEAADPRGQDLGVALNNLAVLYISVDRHSDAERHFKRSIRILEALKDDAAQKYLAKTKLHLAALYVDAGRPKEALKLDIPRVLNSLSDPDDRARARSITAGLALVKKDYSTAEMTYLQVLEYWTKHSDAKNRQEEIAITLNNLGVLALQQGRTDVARTRINRSFEVWQSIEGPASPNVVKSMSNLAALHIQAGEYDEAAGWLARCTALARQTFGDSHPFTVAMQFAHGDALGKAGRKAEAKEVARAAVEARKTMRSPSTADYTVDYRDVIESMRRR